MNKFLASLYNTPWMVEEAWLENMIRMLEKADVSNPESLKTVKTDLRTDSRYAEVHGSTAYIPLHGPIFPRPNMMTEWFGIGTHLEGFSSDFYKVMDDPSVDNIVIDIDSPGGQVTGVNEAANIIRSAQGSKKVTAYVGGTGASAAYWIASAAEEVVIDATARVGSIGVVTAYPKTEDDGYVEIVNTHSPNKRIDPSSEKGKAVITAELDALAEVFINTVAGNRNVSASTVINDFGKGGVLVGQNAVNVGMADRLGSLDELLSNDNNYMIGENSMTLTVDKLKADHKEVFDAVVASVSAEFVAKLETKDSEIASLSTKLAATTIANTSLEERIKALEKADAIRAEKENQTIATLVSEKLLADSSIPQRLHSKVASQISYEKFVDDGKFNKEGYSTALSAEIADWEKEFTNINTVSGVGTAPRQVTDVNAGADDTVLDRLLGHIAIEKEDK